MGAPKMKPRDSMPTTTSTFRLPIFSMRPSIDPRKLSASLSIVVMSLKRIPGLGKSGTSRMRAARSFVVAMRGSLEHPLATRVHVIAREEAFHVAAFVDLDELAHDVDRQFATARDDERRVQRTRERRRDDAVERDVLERVRERHRLLPAAFGERTIGAAREATIAIRFALAVADEIEGGRPHQTPRSVPASAQPLTRVTRSCFTSRFHG